MTRVMRWNLVSSFIKGWIVCECVCECVCVCGCVMGEGGACDLVRVRRVCDVCEGWRDSNRGGWGSGGAN